MTVEEYKNKRNELMSAATGAVTSGDVEAAAAKRAEIEALDENYDAEQRELANLAALKERKIVDITIPCDNTPAPQSLTPTAKMQAEQDEDATYRRAFAHTLMGFRLPAEEAEIFDKVNRIIAPDIQNATQTAATHTVVIPKTLVDAIWKEMGELHPILNAVPKTFVKGKLSYPYETVSGDNAAFYDEDTEVTEGSFTIAALDLDGYELAKALKISWKLQKMSIDSFLAYVANLVAEKMANALAVAVVSGKGVAGSSDSWKSQPQGIITALDAETNTPQVITWTPSTDDVTYEKMTGLMSKIRSGYSTGAAIYAKNDFIWNTLANIKDSNGRPYFIADVMSGGVGRLFGHVVYEEDAIPDNAMLLANIRQGYLMNVQEDISLMQDEHMTKRTTTYMGYAILDGKVRTTKAFAYLKKSS
ncbi:phage major capsid protein [Cloacibacillus porcorum]|uniref:phage major capsid protein n=1 Tax=Cloacibacillus porcorum TaxID=1197717 RepID=UPI003F0B9F4E